MASEVLPVPNVPMLASPQQSQSPFDTRERVSKSVQKNQPSLHSMKILKSGRKKLSSVETQRVLAVLDETIRKLELISLFQHAIENLERYSVVFGSELTGALREHQRLQQNLQMQLSNLNKEATEEKEESTLGKRSMADTAHMNFTLLRQGVQSSVRNILRLFLANPTASKALRSEGHLRDQAFQSLIQSLLELRGFLFEMLLTSPLEQKERIHYLKDITLRDQKNMVVLSALEEELNAATLDRDTEVAKKNEVIQQLKMSLHQLEKSSESQMRRTMQEAEKQQKSDHRASEGKCAKLHQDLQQLRSQLNIAIAGNREVELSLRKKKYKIETEIENWIQKYDTDMGEKQTELEEIEAVYEEEKAQLAEVKEKLAVLEVEYVQIREERHQAQLEKEIEEKELANKKRAATLIQANWKGYIVRREMKSKKKKKKKGKKKGAGGKGKGTGGKGKGAGGKGKGAGGKGKGAGSKGKGKKGKK